jgi:hypothetical protein
MAAMLPTRSAMSSKASRINPSCWAGSGGEAERQLHRKERPPKDGVLLGEQPLQAAFEERVGDGEGGEQEVLDPALHLLGQDGRDHASAPFAASRRFSNFSQASS